MLKTPLTPKTRTIKLENIAENSEKLITEIHYAFAKEGCVYSRRILYEALLAETYCFEGMPVAYLTYDQTRERTLQIHFPVHPLQDRLRTNVYDAIEPAPTTPSDIPARLIP
jgi:hypothetical protein